MIAISLSLIACLCWGMSQFLAGIKTRTLPVLTLMAYTSTAGFMVLATGLGVMGSPMPRDPNLFYAVLAGAMGIGGVYSLYRGLAVGAISIVIPISSLCALLPVIASLIMGEIPGAVQGIGMVAALSGGVLISIPHHTGGQVTPPVKGIIFAIGAALGFGGFFILMDVAGTGDPLWAAAVSRLASFILVMCAVLWKGPKLKIKAAHLPVVFMIGALDTAAAFSYTVATTKGLLSLVAVISSLYPVVPVVLATLFFKERLRGLQLPGVILIILGVMLIST
ncbi:MAG: DMT family transporter [Thermodesulfobacteriota bacterium]